MPIDFPFADPPQNHEALAICPEIYWVRCPLPFSLDHINCYLLQDNAGWCVVDTGMNGKKTQQRWLDILQQSLGGVHISRVIATHHHPDHLGLAGWLCDQYQVPLHCSEAEYFYSRTYHSPKRKQPYWESLQYYQRTDLSQASVNALLNDTSYSHFVAEFPSAFHRIQDQDVLQIGRYQWRAIATRGHSPEHISLYCEALDMYISGDQVLPGITSNVSVTSNQAESNPLQDWFAAHEKIKQQVPDTVTVLPAHELPFKGLHERLDQVVAHHQERLALIEQACKQPSTAQAITNTLFDRELEPFQNFLALGEVVAHLNWLISEKRIERVLQDDVYLYAGVSG